MPQLSTLPPPPLHQSIPRSRMPTSPTHAQPCPQASNTAARAAAAAHGRNGGAHSNPRPSRALAATAAAAAVAAGGLASTTALAEAQPKGGGAPAANADPLASAQAVLTAAWSEVMDDMTRMNARLPANAQQIKGSPPKVRPALCAGIGTCQRMCYAIVGGK